jgi:hypothetical protein
MGTWVMGFIAAAVALMIGAAQTKPADAASNLSAWANLFGIHNPPSWLSHHETDKIVVIVGLCVLVALTCIALLRWSKMTVSSGTVLL